MPDKGGNYKQAYQADVLKKIEYLWQKSEEERPFEGKGFRLCKLDMAVATLGELTAIYSSLTGQQSEGTEQSLDPQIHRSIDP